MSNKIIYVFIYIMYFIYRQLSKNLDDKNPKNTFWLYIALTKYLFQTG